MRAKLAHITHLKFFATHETPLINLVLAQPKSREEEENVILLLVRDCLNRGLAIAPVLWQYSPSPFKTMRPSIQITISAALTSDEVDRAASVINASANGIFSVSSP